MFISDFINLPELKGIFGSRPHHFATELRRFNELPKRKTGYAKDKYVTPQEAAKLIITLYAANSLKAVPETIKLYKTRADDNPTLLDLVAMAIQDGTAQFEKIEFDVNLPICTVIWASDAGAKSIIKADHCQSDQRNFITKTVLESRFLEQLHFDINPTSAKPN